MHAMMSPEQILEHARAAEAAGAHRFCMVTQGQGLSKRDFQNVLDGARLVAEHTNLKRCASIGHMSADRARQLKDAGIQRVHHNVETAESYYGGLDHGPLRGPPAHDRGGQGGRARDLRRRHPQPRRVARAARRDGVPAGRLDPTSVPINLLNPRPGTKFGDRDFMDPWEAVKWIAIFRLILPGWRCLRLCGGQHREPRASSKSLGRQGRVERRDDGQLPSPRSAPEPEDDRAMFEELGLNTARQPDNGANPRPDNRSWLACRGLASAVTDRPEGS